MPGRVEEAPEPLELAQVLAAAAVARAAPDLEGVDVGEPVEHLDAVVAVGAVVGAQGLHLHPERVVGGEVEGGAQRPVLAAAVAPAALALGRGGGGPAAAAVADFRVVAVVRVGAAFLWRGGRGGGPRGSEELLLLLLCVF